VKRAVFAIGILLLTWATVHGQGTSSVTSLTFHDSVRLTLERSRNLDATVVAAAFHNSWNQLRPEHQTLIRRQAYAMRRMKTPLRPHLVDYYGAIASAVAHERADARTISNYLDVAGKVVEKGSPRQLAMFFSASRTFFQHRALNHSKTFRLYAHSDTYSFDFVEQIPDESLSWEEQPEETASDSQDDWNDNATFDPWNDPIEESFEEPEADVMPSWMTPMPPPEHNGPVIRFERLDLVFVTSFDSVALRNTQGSYGIWEQRFSGEGGSFDWTPAGLGPDEVICNMTTYHFNVTKPELSSELVKLNYNGKTPGFIPGTFEFKSQSRRDSTLSSFPRFKSYQNDLRINGLADENVRYRGGFSLFGNRISSLSAFNSAATIEVFSEGQKKFTAKAREFVFSPGSIASEGARVNISQGHDSLVHQMVRMRYRYTDSTQHLLLSKDRGEMRYAPYSSTFFNVDFSADAIRWDLRSDSLNILIEAARNTVPVVIESVDYYDPEDYRLLGSVGFNFHPLALTANYVLKNGVDIFYSGDLANYSKQNPQTIRQAMEYLRQRGLVNYDSQSDVVQVKQKAIDLFLANRGETDYDNLKIHSVTDKNVNATINFKNRSMTVRGVTEFSVSDSLNVNIIPDSSVITILQNRDIQFNGTVNAGNMEISGKGFTLKYDSFFISLTHIDSINFYVKEKNARGQEVRRKVNNNLVSADSATAATAGLGGGSSSGTLFISRANNKSGKEDIPGYPRLDATTGGVIYFDRQEVLGGVYDRSVFFVVPPFKIDSLNNADPLSIKFDGTFISSGMLPSIKETLHTMPDKSLGFEHAIPPPGYQLYKGDGRMNGVLSLSNRGLRGAGTIDFLAAQLSSRDFLFYPDSVVARGSRATIREEVFGNVLFPQASLPDFQMKWFPKHDQLYLKNLKAPFNFYDSTAQMQGVVIISKRGVGGAGKLETRGTELISRDMQFFGKEFNARHARFTVKSDDPNKHLLSGHDVRLKFDLDENYADISPEIEGTAAIEFPYAQFKTSIPNARWDLTNQRIVMTKARDVPIENSVFYTTRKELDSLHFNATRAEYDLRKQELKVSGIPYIIVADAMITPENNEVLIHENARIGTLNNTTIILDTLNGYHRLTDGVVNIVSRKEFTGHATYQYVNLLSDTFAIKMTDFHLESMQEEESQRRFGRRRTGASLQTVATGAVSEKDQLVLGAGMFYKGDMTMYATRPALQLDGYVKLDIKNIRNYDTWIAYSQSGDETEIMLDFDNAVDEEGKRITAGVHFSSLDNSVYLTFASEKKSEGDDDLFSPSGKLYYDAEAKEYRIEDVDKAAGKKLTGKVFAYNDETGKARFEGHVDLFNGTKGFDITSTALGTADFNSENVQLNSFIIVDTDVPAMAFDLMARDLQQVIKEEGSDEGLGDQTELLYKIADIVGERVVKDYETQSLQQYVSLATISALQRPLVFSNVRLRWSPEHKAFYSDGKLGLSNILRHDINGGFEGFMEVRRTAEGVQVFHVFFKASPESWYYFGIEDNRLLIHSNNDAFNRLIAKRSNAGKAKIGETAFIPGSEEETLAFINRFRKNYLGIDVPYSLYEAPPVQSAPVGFPVPGDIPTPSQGVEPGVEPSVEPSAQPQPSQQEESVEPGPARDFEPPKEDVDDGF
jgi:hypothetical protein